MTGRDEVTGEVVDEVKAHSWLGAIAYLVLLDQVGECFQPVPIPRPTAHDKSIPNALTYYQPTLDDESILAIYALRCALAHDYALVNIGKGNAAMRVRLNHRFELVDKPTDPLVELPEIRWDGNLRSPLRSSPTRVNLARLGNLAEDVVRTLQRASSERRLHVVLDGGLDELFNRFAASVWD